MPYFTMLGKVKKTLWILSLTCVTQKLLCSYIKKNHNVLHLFDQCERVSEKGHFMPKFWDLAHCDTTGERAEHRPSAISLPGGGVIPSHFKL